MTTDATASLLPMPAQPLLFDAASLPETAPLRPRRRSGRSAARQEGLGADTVREALPQPLPPPLPLVHEPEPFDPSKLSVAELRALVEALPDQRLAVLIMEAARAIKRRLVCDDPDEVSGEPSPVLIRAAREAAGELIGDDGSMM